MYEIFTLYAFVGGTSAPPEGFDKTPDLETYLNHLGDQGRHVISVMRNECWFTIVTTKED